MTAPSLTDFIPGLQDALHVARTNLGGGDPTLRQPSCTMCVTIRHAAPGPARDALVAAAAGRLSVRALHLSLRSLGVNVSREAISNHRNEAHQP